MDDIISIAGTDSQRPPLSVAPLGKDSLSETKFTPADRHRAESDRFRFGGVAMTSDETGAATRALELALASEERRQAVRHREGRRGRTGFGRPRRAGGGRMSETNAAVHLLAAESPHSGQRRGDCAQAETGENDG